MHLMSEKWTDGQLDGFEKRVDERFDRSDEKIDEVRSELNQGLAEVNRRFEQVDKRLDRLGDGIESVQRAIVFGSITMSAAFAAGLIAFATHA
jgi:tetrahydromethanopterin S-methyltransferase subunit G